MKRDINFFGKKMRWIRVHVKKMTGLTIPFNPAIFFDLPLLMNKVSTKDRYGCASRLSKRPSFYSLLFILIQHGDKTLDLELVEFHFFFLSHFKPPRFHFSKFSGSDSLGALFDHRLRCTPLIKQFPCQSLFICAQFMETPDIKG